MKTYKYLIIISFLSFFTHSKAQEVYGENDVWFLLFNQVNIDEKFSIGNELHMRFNDGLKSKEQFLIRPFINYHRSVAIDYTLGYTFIQTWPYDKYPLPRSLAEHNVWEQITIHQKIGKTTFSHRYRLEQRWRGQLVQNRLNKYELDGFQFSHRFRYRITYHQTISEKLFLNIFDELWVKSDDQIKLTQFDRNWIYLGLGYKFTSHMNIQVAYLHQYIRINDNRFERHPTLQIIADMRF